MDDDVASDHQLIQILRGGGVPPDSDRLARALARWWGSVHSVPVPEFEPLFEQLVGERLFEPTRPGYDSSGQVPATAMMGETRPPGRTFVGADGETYQRVSSAEFESFDDVDSTTIVDAGAPD